MTATILYLLTVACCLYVSVYFPGFEGVDQRIMFPLVVASAAQAALHQRHPILGFWRNWLAACWLTGCTLACTPHLFLTEPATQIVVQRSAVALAGGGLAIGAIKGVVMSRALPMSTRALYGGALLVTGVVLVAIGVPVVPRMEWAATEWAATQFEAIVVGVTLLTVMSAIAGYVGTRRRPTSA